MLNRYLKTRISDARKLVKDLRKHYDYASVLGTCVSNRYITVSTHVNSIDEVDSECGFVIKVYKDGRYSEYSCNDIRGLKAGDVIKAVKLKKIVSADFKVRMLEEKEHVRLSSRGQEQAFQYADKRQTEGSQGKDRKER